MTKAVYTGSFDPFTFGHLDIVKKASAIFDKVIILIAENPNKTRHFNRLDMQVAIEKDLEMYGLDNVEVDYTTGLVADYCFKKDIKYIVRGLRNTTDYQYEENMAKINQSIHGYIETIYLRASQKYEHCSSTFAREMLYFMPVTTGDYIPYHVNRLCRGN